jgi:antitoxin component of MazEF toxin-antitoxin module
MVVRPGVPVYRIEDLVRGITSKNRHPEFDTGGPVGNEII